MAQLSPLSHLCCSRDVLVGRAERKKEREEKKGDRARGRWRK